MDPCHFGIGNGGYDCTAGYFGAIQLPVLPYPGHYKRVAIRAHDAVGACRLRHMAGRRSAVSIFFLGGFNRNGQCAYLGAFVGLSNHAGSVRELGNLGVLAP